MGVGGGGGGGSPVEAGVGSGEEQEARSRRSGKARRVYFIGAGEPGFEGMSMCFDMLRKPLHPGIDLLTRVWVLAYVGCIHDVLRGVFKRKVV